MAKKKKTTKSKPSVSFEASLAHLKESLAALESQELTLEESLEQYETGISHLRNCHLALDQAKQKIEKLVRVDEDGNLILRPFDNTATEQMTKGTRRGTGEKPLQAANGDDSSQEGNGEFDELGDSESLF